MADKELRQIPISAMFIALGIIFPQIFHMVGAGSVFLPMFLPIYLGSMFLNWKYSTVVAVVTPTVSFLITGMPPVVPPVLFLMIGEFLFACIIISSLHFHLQKNVWLSLITGSLTGRVLYFFAISVILPMFGFESKLLSLALVLKSFPGVILQFLIIPATVKIISKKYPSLVSKG